MTTIPQEEKYNIRFVEAKWQAWWARHKPFAVPPSLSPQDKPFYVLAMFPYPSGTLHMGHARNYTITDVLARFKWALGYTVLHPMGWDACGLPAENAALNHQVHPREWTYANARTMKEQCLALGFGHDWDREIFSCDPKYFVHEQKMFLALLRQGLAYRKQATLNWDPVDQCVLANEQVIDGKGWRSGAVVQQRTIEQWFLRITDFAESLLDDLQHLTQWPEAVRQMQAHWIGKSQGLWMHWACVPSSYVASFSALSDHSLSQEDPPESALSSFAPLSSAMSNPWATTIFSNPYMNGLDHKLSQGGQDSSGIQTSQHCPRDHGPGSPQLPRADAYKHPHEAGVLPVWDVAVFSTRPETLYGATFCAIAPDHPLTQACSQTNPEVHAFIQACQAKGTAEHLAQTQDKKGVFLDFHARNPVTGEWVPVYAANFVRSDYGSGAVFGCPGHDPRDYEFACLYHLPVRHVLQAASSKSSLAIDHKASQDHACYPGDEQDILCHSGPLDGMTVAQARQAVQEMLGQGPVWGWRPMIQDKEDKTNSALSKDVAGEGKIYERTGSDPLVNVQCRILASTGSCSAWEWRVFSPQQREQACAQGWNLLPAHHPKTMYRLRDWGIGRQRYWGVPIPIIYCAACGVVPVPEKDLPVVLPEDVTFDKPGNPLDHHPTWQHVPCPQCGQPARRETDTFDTFFESSWYFARFCDVHNDNTFCDSALAKTWLPVNQYVGGIEHAILHLLYARFFAKALKKCGYWDISEPFKGLFTQGMVCHKTFRASNGAWLYPHEVNDKGQRISDQTPVTVGRSEKMSKSKCNVIGVTDMVQTYGADAVRLFVISDTPAHKDLEWTDEGIAGSWRYVRRLWALAVQQSQWVEAVRKSVHNLVPGDVSWKVQNHQDQDGVHNQIRVCLPSDAAITLRSAVHEAIDHITQALHAYELNKYAAYLRGLTNAITQAAPHLVNSSADADIMIHALHTLTQLMAPVMPHLAEELGCLWGWEPGLHHRPWPVHEPRYVTTKTPVWAVQINGKHRGQVLAAADASQEEVVALVQACPALIKHLQGTVVQRVIMVPGRLINIVLSSACSKE